jgi:hypothetical protein
LGGPGFAGDHCPGNRGLSHLSDGGASRRRNSRRPRTNRGHTTRRRCTSASHQAGCRPRRRRKRTTSWKALPSRNAGIWSPSICWNGPISHCPARTCRNETRKSAWQQNSGLLRNLKLCFQALPPAAGTATEGPSQTHRTSSQLSRELYARPGCSVFGVRITGCAGRRCVKAYSIR